MANAVAQKVCAFWFRIKKTHFELETAWFDSASLEVYPFVLRDFSYKEKSVGRKRTDMVSWKDKLEAFFLYSCECIYKFKGKRFITSHKTLGIWCDIKSLKNIIYIYIYR